MIENLSHARVIQLVETLAYWWTFLQPELRSIRYHLHLRHRMRDFKFLVLSKGSEKGGLRRQVNTSTTSDPPRVVYPPKSPSLTDVSLIGSDSVRHMRDESPPAGIDEYKNGGRRRSRSGGSVSTVSSIKDEPPSHVADDLNNMGEYDIL